MVERGYLSQEKRVDKRAVGEALLDLGGEAENMRRTWSIAGTCIAGQWAWSDQSNEIKGPSVVIRAV